MISIISEVSIKSGTSEICSLAFERKALTLNSQDRIVNFFPLAAALFFMNKLRDFGFRSK